MCVVFCLTLSLWVTGCGGEEPASAPTGPPEQGTQQEPAGEPSGESSGEPSGESSGESSGEPSGNNGSVEKPKPPEKNDSAEESGRKETTKPNQPNSGGSDNDGEIPGIMGDFAQKKNPSERKRDLHQGHKDDSPTGGRFNAPRGPDFSRESTSENPFPMSQFEREAMRAMGRPSEHELRSYSLPLNNPPVVSVKEATHMRDDEAVLGILVGDEARAYPWWIVIAFHVINDTFSHEVVYVAQCEVCSGAGAFRPIIDGWPLDFRVCGGLHGTFYVCDFQTKSSWYSFSGTAFKGPLKGRQLERLPAYQTTWGEWKKLHPHTTVIHAPRTIQKRPHGHGQYMGKPVVEHQLEMTIRHRDSRMEENVLVIGLFAEDQKTGRVFPIEEVRKAGGLVSEEFDGKPVVLWLQGQYRISAYERTLDGEVLNFEVASKKPFRVKDQSGSTWNEWGTAVSGPHKGKKLALTQGYVTEWYEWIGHYPGSTIFRLKN